MQQCIVKNKKTERSGVNARTRNIPYYYKKVRETHRDAKRGKKMKQKIQ